MTGQAAGGAPAPARARLARCCIVGAGTMGSGIATSFATHGVGVTLVDLDARALHGGLARIDATLAASVRKGRTSESEAAAIRARVQGASSLDAARDADLVIEAVFESMAVKREVFAQLDRVCGGEAVLATNTSTLDIDEIAAATSRPQRVLGLHFFSPANVMRLVEIVRGRATAPEVLAYAQATCTQIGKLGVVVGNCFGFVGNRMLYAYGRENQLMLLEGAPPQRIDAALQRFGMAMGPNAVGDLAGLDVGYRVRRERKDRPDDPRWFRVADLLVEGGRLGQKTSAGTFRYEPGSREPLPDPAVDALIAAEAQRLGIERREIGDEEIVDRCIHALVNEGALLLGEGIAATAADVDTIWVHGYGFPRTRGGPMAYADSLGLARVLQQIREYERAHGSRYWRPAPLLVELADAGASFAEWDARRAAHSST